MTDQTDKTGLIVSAHAADFVWRAGGAAALYAQRGWRVDVICLSNGERGESAKMWNQPNMTLEQVTVAREIEARKAASILGVRNIEFYGLRDYPMRVPDDTVYRVAAKIRELRPEWILTHSLADPYNFDHPLAAHITQEARVIAQAHGHNYPEKPIGAPPVYLFEPHQTEQCDFKPQHILDITSVWQQKRAAFECMAAQEYLWDYYTRVALNRGIQGKRNSGRDMIYGEAYQRIFSTASDVFV